MRPGPSRPGPSRPGPSRPGRDAILPTRFLCRRCLCSRCLCPLVEWSLPSLGHLFQLSNHQSGHVTTFEPAVDVDHCDTRRTGCQHRHQGGQSAEIGAIADTGGNRKNRDRQIPGHDRRQRSLHPGDDDDDGRFAKRREGRHQSLWSRHSDIFESLDRDSHPMQRLHRLFRDRRIGAAGRHDRRMKPLARFLGRQGRWRRHGRWRDTKGSCHRVVIGKLKRLTNLKGDATIDPRDQSRLT